MFCHHTVAFARSDTLAWPMRRRLSSHLSCLTRSPSVRIQIQRTGDPLSESTNISTTIEPPRREEGETSKFGNGGRPRPVSLVVPFVAPDPSDRVKRRRKRPDGRNATPRYSSLLYSLGLLLRQIVFSLVTLACHTYILTQPELAPLPHPACVSAVNER